MGRQSRASGLKALQAIKTKSKLGKSKTEVENEVSRGPCVPAIKRTCPLKSSELPKKKRTALGVIEVNTIDEQPSKPPSKALPKAEETASSCVEETPVTAVKNSLKAARLSESDVSKSSPQPSPPATIQPDWNDIDKAEAADPLFSAEYAPDIYHYMRQREVYFMMPAYMSSQPDITANMRTILVDWLIEVQENFELFHETLYLAVKLTDRYLANKDIQREYLQLVGATCMLIAAKFEELSPPLVEDFLYLCDEAYTHEDILKMEQDILRVLEYDVNMPVAYRFLRRLARAAEATMETHTLARYISESTLQDYSFVTDYPSMIAAGAMYLALRMKALGPWTSTLVHYSGYTKEQLLPLVKRLNTLIQTPLGQTATVRQKYSHEVFFKVATIPALTDVEEDSRTA